MKKIICFFLTAIIVLIIGTAFFLTNRTDPQDKMEDMLNRVENALGDEWKKQTVTEVSDFVYSDNEGNTIIYYVCVTTYFEADASNQSGLNIEAISAVVNPEEAIYLKECTVTDHPAAIYQKDDRAYLCWTIMPELSCVLEYDPAIESEANMFRMAESVPANRNS